MPSEYPEQRFAIAVIVDQDGQVLLLKRDNRSRLGAGLWGFVGGHIRPGETPQAAMQRELLEELGDKHELELQESMGPVRDRHYGGRFEVHLFHYRWLSGDIRLNHEHSTYVWVNRDDWGNYAVMDGIDDDLAYFDIWPRHFLHADQLSI
jgi:8-oxo-dGTP pyrophosphatase MutT (NUDIX family)